MKILITAGPTREALDPVRYLSNRSSGVLGYALAQEAKKRGHYVTLISGPVALPAPKGISFISIESAQDLQRACEREFKKCDILIMSAAVCDFTAARVESQKIKRQGSLKLNLKKTPDILAGLAKKKGRRFVIGFCLESSDWLKKAKDKLSRKALDGIVANSISPQKSPFGDQKVMAALLDSYGKTMIFKQIAKPLLARRILIWVEGLRAIQRSSNTESKK